MLLRRTLPGKDAVQMESLDVNVMVMEDNGEIWRKLSASVMIYIPNGTATFHLEWVFNPPPFLRPNSV